MLAAFAVLFVLGFLLYSLLYAALGSLVSRQEDVQSATSPLMMLIMVGYFMSIFGLQAIDETWVKIASFIPFFSPYLMLARVSVGHVALWEFALAVVLLLAAIAVALVVAARIYSAGVLLYGQRVGPAPDPAGGPGPALAAGRPSWPARPDAAAAQSSSGSRWISARTGREDAVDRIRYGMQRDLARLCGVSIATGRSGGRAGTGCGDGGPSRPCRPC